MLRSKVKKTSLRVVTSLPEEATALHDPKASCSEVTGLGVNLRRGATILDLPSSDVQHFERMDGALEVRLHLSPTASRIGAGRRGGLVDCSWDCRSPSSMEINTEIPPLHAATTPTPCPATYHSQA